MVEIHLCNDPLYQRIVRLPFLNGFHRNFTEFFKARIHFVYHEAGNLRSQYAEIIGYNDEEYTQ